MAMANNDDMLSSVHLSRGRERNGGRWTTECRLLQLSVVTWCDEVACEAWWRWTAIGCVRGRQAGSEVAVCSV